jgi:1-acyl-sn-glycerol-3-phosphate acyltransferase
MLKRIAHTVFVFICLLVLCLLYLVPFVVLLCVGQKKRLESKIAFFIVHSFYRLLLWCLFIPIVVHGKKNLPKEPAIFIANHQSSIDIPLLGMLAQGRAHVWLARSDAVRSGMLRYFMSFFSIIVNLSSSISSYRSIRTLLSIANETQAHIMLFPEGGRYTDGKIHEFVEGFSFLAKKTGRPVVPVCILGVQYVYPPTAYFISRFPVHIIIGEPIWYTEDMTDEAFKQKVRIWYQQQIKSD